MANTGTNLAKNPFKRAMDSSYSNAGEISSKTLAAIVDNQDEDDRIAALVDYYTPLNDALQQKVIDYYSDFDTRKAVTTDIITFEDGIPAEVRAWWRMLTDVYAEGTGNFNRLWNGGNTSFYNQKRNENKNRMETLVTSIGTDTSLATLKTRVTAYVGTYKDLIDSQTGDKTTVKTDTAEIDEARDAATNGLWYCYCVLNTVFLPDVDKTIAFFPMELIYKASKMRQYRLLVPKATKRKICMRTWKATDSIVMVNNRTVELQVGLAEKSSGTPATWYNLGAGATVKIAPSALGNTAFKFAIVQNPSLTETGDITFTILEE